MSSALVIRELLSRSRNRCLLSSQVLVRCKSAMPRLNPVESTSIDVHISTPRKQEMPPSGWKKSIVSSSFCSMPEMAATLPPPTANDREILVSSERDGQYKLEVDLEELRVLASQKCTPLTLKDMYKYAIDFNDQEQRLRNAQFLHKELPIRIAQRAVDLLTLPHGLSDATKIRRVAHVYLRYIEMFQEFPVPTTPEEEERFTEMLKSVILDRTSIPMAISQGLSAWLLDNDNRDGIEMERLQEMEDALYRFFTARVGLRFLIEHHILSSPSRFQHEEVRKSMSSCDDTDDPFLGCIQTNCCPGREVRKVAADISRQTKEYYGVCPEIQIVDSTRKQAKFTYVPHHLHYMTGELIKNACRATVEKFFAEKENATNGETPELHPIRVIVVKGDEDVTIKVCDRGGGIPRSKVSKIWKFAHSTMTDDDKNAGDFSKDAVAGTKIRGFGLPLARIYARYLGGELTLKSMEGYGLDAYLHLPRLGDSCENLPSSVRKSPSNLDSMPVVKGLKEGKARGMRSYSTSSNKDIIIGGFHGEGRMDESTLRILELL